MKWVNCILFSDVTLTNLPQTEWRLTENPVRPSGLLSSPIAVCVASGGRVAPLSLKWLIQSKTLRAISSSGSAELLMTIIPSKIIML